MLTLDEKVLEPEIKHAAVKPIAGKGSGLLTKATTQKLVGRVVVGVALVLVVLVLISHKNVIKTKHVTRRHAAADIGSVVTKANPLIAAPADKRAVISAPVGGNDVTPQAIEMTRNPAIENARKAQEAQNPDLGQANSAVKSTPYHSLQDGNSQMSNAQASSGQHAKPLNLIHPFDKSTSNADGKWQPTPYAAQAAPTSLLPPMSQEEKKAFSDQVTKQSVTFTLTNQTSVGSQSSSNVYPITNLGLKEGYHIGARTETSASTASQNVPVVAEVQYDYLRDGKVLIPAGSRAIGKLTQADQSGNVGVAFSTLQFPDGSSIEITAVALDKNMMPIKGIVTGKNIAKQFLVATMAGLGEATAMVAGGSNMSGAYSQSDMIKQQASMNIGNAADSQIQMLNNGQHIVVTIPAGTEINIVFVKPPQETKPK